MPEDVTDTDAGTDAGTEITAEDRKLITLARATRARTGAAQGAAVRDTDGRTYAAATVELPSLRLSAIAGCVAMAHSSGSTGLDAVVLLGDDAAATAEDTAVLEEFAGSPVSVLVTDARGRPTTG